MFNKLLNKKLVKNEKGLTLIELLAVIVVLAIISAIAIPSIGNIMENTRYNAVKADAINVLNAAQLYYTDNPEGDSGVSGTETSVTVKQLIEAKYLETAGAFETNAADISVANTNPKKLTTPTTTPIKYSGKKTVKFTDATIDLINKDKQKGSQDTITEIK